MINRASECRWIHPSHCTDQHVWVWVKQTTDSIMCTMKGQEVFFIFLVYYSSHCKYDIHSLVWCMTMLKICTNPLVLFWWMWHYYLSCLLWFVLVECNFQHVQPSCFYVEIVKKLYFYDNCDDQNVLWWWDNPQVIE